MDLMNLIVDDTLGKMLVKRLGGLRSRVEGVVVLSDILSELAEGMRKPRGHRPTVCPNSIALCSYVVMDLFSGSPEEKEAVLSIMRDLHELFKGAESE